MDLPSMSPLAVASAVLAIFIASRYAKVWLDVKATGHLPGFRMPFSPNHPLGAAIPTSRFNMGLVWGWLWRQTTYERFGSDTISAIGFLFGSPMIYTASKEVSDDLLAHKGRFIKPAEAAALITVPFGPNMLGSEGEEWKRHRRIIQPAFNKETYKHVWEESFGLFDEMSEAEGWNDKDEVLITPINSLTSRFTLLIIARCGFGHHLDWQTEAAPNGEMNISDALDFVAVSALVHLIIPPWAFKLPVSWLQKTNSAFITVKDFLAHLITNRKESLKDSAATEDHRPDVFTRMVHASNKEGKGSFSDAELAGNTFLLLFAGHDTTALTLAAVLGFLAIYPEIQHELYEEICSVCTSDAHWAFDVASSLVKTEAAIVEAARMYPAASQMLRAATEDTILQTHEPHINGGVLKVKKGQNVNIDLVGIHYNPRYFPDPEEFRPSRWYGKNDSEYTMFSWGPRACIGRRFALTESICFLAKLLRTWRVEPILNQGETTAQWRGRVMRARTVLTLGVSDVPLRLLRRSQATS